MDVPRFERRASSPHENENESYVHTNLFFCRSNSQAVTIVSYVMACFDDCPDSRFRSMAPINCGCPLTCGVFLVSIAFLILFVSICVFFVYFGIARM